MITIESNMVNDEECLAVRQTPVLKYNYAAGKYGSLFLRGLKEGKIFASKSAHAVMVPPRMVCAKSLTRMEEIVELPRTGTLLGFTQVAFPFIDPFTGENRPVPYCYGMIKLDGASNALQHFLEEKDYRKLRVGMRVEAVFRPEAERTGSYQDIQCFRSLE